MNCGVGLRRWLASIANCILTAVMILCPIITIAATWRDNFDDNHGESLRGWTVRGKHTLWTAMEGFLHADQQPPIGLDMVADFVELTAFVGPHTHIQVNLTGMKALGLGLGKVFDMNSTHASYYAFNHGAIRAYSLDRRGTGWSQRLGDWVPRNPGTIWRDPPPMHLAVVFHEGDFKMFVDDELRMEFADPAFQTVEYIILLTFNVGADLDGRLDAFEISGPAVPSNVFSVSPGEKLVASWAGLKMRF